MATGEGLIVRFDRIPGATPKGVLDQPLRLPAVLGAVSVEEEAGHSEFDTISGGQFSQPTQGGSGSRKLRGLSLEALTLDYDAEWLVESGQDPEAVKAMLYAILRSKKPVTMMIVVKWGEPNPMLRMNCTFRSVHEELRPAENDTRYFVLGIKEWRTQSIERKGEHEGRKPGVKFPTTVQLKSSDTLYSLAHEYYGRYEFWRDIRAANGISKKFGQSTPIVSLPAYKPGSSLKLPIVAPASDKSKTIPAKGH